MSIEEHAVGGIICKNASPRAVLVVLVKKNDWVLEVPSGLPQVMVTHKNATPSLTGLKKVTQDLVRAFVPIREDLDCVMSSRLSRGKYNIDTNTQYTVELNKRAAHWGDKPPFLWHQKKSYSEVRVLLAQGQKPTIITQSSLEEIYIYHCKSQNSWQYTLLF